MYWKKTPSILKKFFPKFIWSIPNERNTVYLTFDDGPFAGITDKLLDILKAKDVTASFFCLGENIVENPLLFEKIKADGHFVGNHGWSHLNGWKVSKKAFLENLSKGEKNVNNKVFRPPYGKIPFRLSNLIAVENKVVMWDVLSGDFDPNMNANQCLEEVIKNVCCGSIIVFHDNPKSSKIMLEVVPLLIDKLKDKSFTFDNLSILADRN